MRCDAFNLDKEIGAADIGLNVGDRSFSTQVGRQRLADRCEMVGVSKVDAIGQLVESVVTRAAQPVGLCNHRGDIGK